MENKNKFEELIKDKDFSESIIKMETPEEVQKAFAEKGVEISKEEVQALGAIINKACEKKGAALSEEDLNEISGGSIGDVAKEFGAALTLNPLGGILLAFADSNNSSASIAERAADLSGSIVGTALTSAAAYGGYKGVKWAYGKINKKIRG